MEARYFSEAFVIIG